MLPNCDRSGSCDLPAAERAAIDAIASVVVAHLGDDAKRRSPEASAPTLIQIDGVGAHAVVGAVAKLLQSGQVSRGRTERSSGKSPSEPAGTRATRSGPSGSSRHREPASARGWTIVHFDAWQYQRLAPPWWWLVNSVDRQLRMNLADSRRTVRFAKRLRDYSGERGSCWVTCDLFCLSCFWREACGT